jgi:hypothetical protein
MDACGFEIGGWLLICSKMCLAVIGAAQLRSMGARCGVSCPAVVAGVQAAVAVLQRWSLSFACALVKRLAGRRMLSNGKSQRW